MEFAVDIQVTESGRRRPEYTLNSDLDGKVSLQDFLEFTRASLIVIADEVLTEERAKGFRPAVTLVDGSPSKPVHKVNPLGTIEFIAKAPMKDILLETYNGILGRSPVLTGDYKRSHYVFLNGRQVATDLASLEAWLNSNPTFEEKDLIRFVNIQPYARKLELLGVTGQRQQSRTVKSRNKNRAASGATYRVPNGTYFLTARSIRSKYKRNSIIRFSFISGQSLGITGSFKTGRKGKPGRPYLYPTITISVQESGIA